MSDIWKPLQSEDPLFDNRLLIGAEVATWLPHRNRVFDYTPQQMAAMGVFGDAYWADDLGSDRWLMLTRATGARLVSDNSLPCSHRSIRGKQCKDVNYYGAAASLLRGWWLDKGLIYSYDPLGWYEWFWWYSLGRSLPKYDAWQINRRAKFKARHMRMYKDTPCYNQSLLHWAIRTPAHFV